MIKMVRDNIPAIIVAEGKEPKYVQVEDISPYGREKLQEELNEVLNAPSKDNLTVELADLLEVMIKYGELNGIEFDAVLEAMIEKSERVGGFDNNTVLEFE